MTAKQIVVHYAFPDNDPTKAPYVTNSTSEVDDVASSYLTIEWSLSGGHHEVHPGITGVSFFSDAAKTRPVTPPFLNMPGGNNGGMNFIIGFKAGTAVPDEVTLYYTLHFRDDRFSGLNWDPTMKIKPRTSAEGAAGAGGN